MKKKTFNFLAAMRKNMMTAAILGMAMMTGCGVMTGCSSSSDDFEQKEPEKPGEPEHKPVESIFVKTMKSYPVSGWEYKSTSNPNVNTLELHSEAVSGKLAHDRWVIGMYLEADPGLDKWQGTYEISQVWGSVHGFVDGEFWETSKATLDTGDNVVPVKGAWIKMEDTGRKNSYGNKEYHIQLHIDEMKEENGDYARDINVEITSFRENNMLEY